MAKKMEVVKGRTEKLSYEDLEKAAHGLSEQNEMLRNQISQMNNINLFKRLDYLFKVVELGGSFSVDFVDACANEIKSMITIPENVGAADSCE